MTNHDLYEFTAECDYDLESHEWKIVIKDTQLGDACVTLPMLEDEDTVEAKLDELSRWCKILYRPKDIRASKKCPFCNELPIIEHHYTWNDGLVMFHIEHWCSKSGIKYGYVNKNKARLVKTWNTYIGQYKDYES